VRQFVTERGRGRVKFGQKRDIFLDWFLIGRFGNVREIVYNLKNLVFSVILVMFLFIIAQFSVLRKKSLDVLLTYIYLRSWLTSYFDTILYISHVQQGQLR